MIWSIFCLVVGITGIMYGFHVGGATAGVFMFLGVIAILSGFVGDVQELP